MVRVKTILAVTDHSEQAAWAERRAEMLGAQLRATMLELLTVAPREASMGQVLGAALRKGGPLRSADVVFGAPGHAKARKEIGAPPCVRTAGFGDPATIVARRSAELPADLTVVGMRDGLVLLGAHGPADGADLLRKIDRPVLLVRTAPREAYRRSLLAIDFEPGAGAAAELALALAPQAHHTLFHVTGDPADDAGQDRDMVVVYLPHYRSSDVVARRMNALATTLGAHGHSLSWVVRFGEPAAALVEFARRLEVDLVAIGRNGVRTGGEHWPGAVAGRLMRELDCDVLIVPEPDDDWDGGAAA